MTTTTGRPSLPDFEQTEVTRATVKITNAGDGLSDALTVQPQAIALGDEKFYLLRGTCVKVSHDEDKHEQLVRVHTIKASEITDVDGKVATQMLAAAAMRIEEKKAAMEGQLLLTAEQDALEREANDRQSSNVNTKA